jgi:hypothetical protein
VSASATFCRLLAAALLCVAFPMGAQEATAPPVSARTLAAQPTSLLFPRTVADGSTSLDEPTSVARPLLSVPRPGLGTGVGVLGGAAVGGFYAWGLGGEGWLGHSDTPKMILAGAVTGAILGYTVDFILHQFRD